MSGIDKTIRDLGQLERAIKGTVGSYVEDMNHITKAAIDMGLNLHKSIETLDKVKYSLKDAFDNKDIDAANELLLEYIRNMDKLKASIERAEAVKGLGSRATNKDGTYNEEVIRREITARRQAADEALRTANRIEAAERKTAAAASAANDQMVADTKEMTVARRAFWDGLWKGINNAMNKIISIVRSGFGMIAGTIQGIVKVFGTLQSVVGRILGLFGNFGNRIRQSFGLASTGAYGTGGAFNMLSGTATELYSKIRLLQMAFSALFNGQMTAKAEKLFGAVYAMKSTLGGEITSDTIKWAESMERAFGLDSRQLLQDVSQISVIMKNLGMTSENATMAGKNLTMMGRHMAAMGHYGGNIAAVQTAILSGIKGETEAIDNLGLSVRNSQMNAYLENLRAQGGEYVNIGTKLENMTEAQRAYVRTAAIMDQYMKNYSMTDYINSLDTVIGRMSILRQATSALGSTISSVFLKAFSYIAPYITVIVNFISGKIIQLANLIGKLFGVDMSVKLGESMNGGAAGVANVAEAVGDVNDELDKTASKANKAKGALLGFDKVSSIDSTSGSSAGGVGGIGAGAFDYSSLLQDGLKGLNDLANGATESYMDKLESKFSDKLNKMTVKFNEFVKKTTGRKDFDIEFNQARTTANLKKTLVNAFETVKNVGGLGFNIALRVADDVNIGKLVTEFSRLAAAVSYLGRMASEALAPVMIEFYESFVRPMVESAGVKISKFLNDWSSKAERLAGVFRAGGWDAGVKHFKDEILATNPTLDLLFEGLASLVELGKTLYKDVFKPLLANFGEFVKNEFLPWLVDKLKDIQAWISENKEKLVDLIERIANFAWGSFKLFVEVVLKLIDLSVKHPNALIAVFGAVMGLKFVSWAGSAYISVKNLVDVLGKLGLFKGKFKSFTAAVSGAGKGLLTKAGGAGKGLLTKAGGAGKGLLTKAGGAGKGLLTKAGGLMKNPVTGIIAGTVTTGLDAYKGVKRSEEIFGERGKTTQAKVASGIGGAVGGDSVLGNTAKYAAIGAGVGSFVPGIGTAIGAGVGAAAGAVTGFIGSENIAKGFDTLMTNIRNTGQGAADFLKTVFGGVSESSNESWRSAETGAIVSSDNIKTGASNKFNELKTNASNALDFIKIAATGLPGPFGLAFSTAARVAQDKLKGLEAGASGVATNILTAFSTALGRVSGLFDDLKRGIAGLWDKSKEFVSGVGSGVKNFFTGGGPKIGTNAGISTIPGFADGGIIPYKSGALYTVGENKKPELMGTFGGVTGTGVANTEMVTEAMRRAMRDGIVSGMRDSGVGRGGQTINVYADIVDDNTLEPLARKLALLAQGSNNNIADIGFSMS